MAGQATLTHQVVGCCAPPTTINTGSEDTICEGNGAARVGDTSIPHGIPIVCPTHTPVAASGNYSETVIINGKNAVKVGTVWSCGANSVQGCEKVDIG